MTLCNLVTVFADTKGVTKSRLHCIYWVFQFLNFQKQNVYIIFYIFFSSFFISVRPSLEPGWLEGCLDGKRGLVPENYVEFLN